MSLAYNSNPAAGPDGNKDVITVSDPRSRFQRSASARVSAEDQESSMAKFCRRLNSLESAGKRGGKFAGNKDLREASVEDDQEASTPVADLVIRRQ
jgi:hypothetical protein